MKKLILSFMLLSSLTFASNKSYIIKNNTLLCHKESDAIRADIVVGLQNATLVKEYDDSKKCTFVTPDRKIKFKILQSKKVPAGKSYITIHKIKILDTVNGRPPKDFPKLWIGDIMKRYK